MADTRERLDEARFFLSELQSRYHNMPTFRYYLNAFITSARSVSWIMKAEFNDVEGWAEWYKSKQPTPEEQLLLKQTTDARNRSQKQGPLKPVYQLTVIVDAADMPVDIEELKKKMIGKTFLLDVKGVSEDMSQEVLIVGDENDFVGEVERFFMKLDDFQNEDVLKICSSYFSFLERMVDECEQLFGPH
jgi:hypothetical protein